MPSPTDVPTPPSTFGEGKIAVGKDAAAGTYRVGAPVTEGCVWALQPADSPTERQPGDTRVPDDADGADQAVSLGRDIQLTEQRPAVRPGDPSARIDLDAAHL